MKLQILPKNCWIKCQVLKKEDAKETIGSEIEVYSSEYKQKSSNESNKNEDKLPKTDEKRFWNRRLKATHRWRT